METAIAFAITGLALATYAGVLGRVVFLALTEKRRDPFRVDGETA
jgi:hypothetical protein